MTTLTELIACSPARAGTQPTAESWPRSASQPSTPSSQASDSPGRRLSHGSQGPPVLTQDPPQQRPDTSAAGEMREITSRPARSAVSGSPPRCSYVWPIGSVACGGTVIDTLGGRCLGVSWRVCAGEGAAGFWSLPETPG